MKHLKLYESFVINKKRQWVPFQRDLLECSSLLKRSSGEPGKRLGKMMEKFANLLIDSPQKLDNFLIDILPLAKKILRVKGTGLFNYRDLEILGIDERAWRKLEDLEFRIQNQILGRGIYFQIPQKALFHFGLVFEALVFSLGDIDMMNSFEKQFESM